MARSSKVPSISLYRPHPDHVLRLVVEVHLAQPGQGLKGAAAVEQQLAGLPLVPLEALLAQLD
jgi:hypothetical protein